MKTTGHWLTEQILRVLSLLEILLGHCLTVCSSTTISLQKTQQQALHQSFHPAEMRKGDTPKMQ